MHSTVANAGAGAHDSGPKEHFIGFPGKMLRKLVSPNTAHRSVRRVPIPEDPTDLREGVDMLRTQGALDRATLAQVEAKAKALGKQLAEQKRWAEEELKACKSFIDGFKMDKRIRSLEAACGRLPDLETACGRLPELET